MENKKYNVYFRKGNKPIIDKIYENRTYLDDIQKYISGDNGKWDYEPDFNGCVGCRRITAQFKNGCYLCVVEFYE